MTSLQIARNYIPYDRSSESLIKELADAIDQTLREERERCADLAAGLHEHYAEMRREAGDTAPTEWSRACQYVAERIRSLK